ncbi:hypothetical protein V6N13_130264 [Hibiscus sabdariffa]|uniref:Uncharacterized protein n=1 Tax=Hibiscus sabdariffa TaxID=183260 RepID=A0ABR2SNU8_9ROSI
MVLSPPKVSKFAIDNPSVEHANQDLQPLAGGVVGRPPDSSCDGLAKSCLEGQVLDLPRVEDVEMVGNSMEETTLADTVVVNSDLVASPTISFVAQSAKAIPSVSFRDILGGSTPAHVRDQQIPELDVEVQPEDVHM